MTQVLTSQKAAELLKELRYAKSSMGQLSIRDEYFKQALEQLPRWIACDERMPEPFKPVLAFEEGYSSIMCWNNGKYWQEFNTNDDFHVPTHWMPLPEAPL